MVAENYRFETVTDDKILQIEINTIQENSKNATKYELNSHEVTTFSVLAHIFPN